MPTNSCTDSLPPDQAQTSQSPSVSRTKTTKLPLHVANIERGSAEGTASRGDDSSSGSHEGAQVKDGTEVVKEDDKSIDVPGSADPTKVESTIESGTTTNTTKTRTRPSVPSMKPIRFPPMSSPGLLMSIPPAGAFRETVDPSTGLATPAAVFEHAMSLAGYTLENRTKKPHRGSSVQRVVDDMFDSNVKSTLHFPKLMPEGLLDDVVSGKLMQAFRSAPSHSKKRRLPGFSDMAPISLTIPYPEEYIRRRLEYVEKVKAREQSIVTYQEQELALDKEREVMELPGKSVPDGCDTMVVIPPIPEPPSPPRIHELDGFDPDAFEDNHPLYPPRLDGDHSLVGHLDKDCFHVVDGRYFGLSSNRIADPNFCGPNAPGLHGLSLSGGTGLATANTGGGSSATLLTAPGASVNVHPHSKQIRELKGAKLSTTGIKRKAGAKRVSNTNNGDARKLSQVSPRKKTAKLALAPKKKKTNGPKPTASLNDLRNSLEVGGDQAEVLHTCIVRSAVYASRCGKHSRSWRAPNGKVFPDIGKAFRSYAKVQPCEKCKLSNMDAYHCRLRRRHNEPDYNGGDSFAAWVPLFKLPMEALVVRGPKPASAMAENGKSTAVPATVVPEAPDEVDELPASAAGFKVACVEREDSAAHTEGRLTTDSVRGSILPESEANSNLDIEGKG